MHVFVTGATGWVGSAVVRDLLQAGHRVTGLARSADKAEPLKAAGAEIVLGSLEDLDALTGAARFADAVVHTAFNHDFSKFADNAAQDERVINALGAALEGSDGGLIVTAGLSGLPRGAVETDGPNPTSLRKSDAAALALRAKGRRVSAVRLPPSVHGVGDHGFVPILIDLARRTGVSAWPEENANVWSGVHRLDAARVYRLALEDGLSRPIYHAVADEAVPMRAIAERIARGLGLPAEARPRDHFGWFAMMAGADMSASSAATREQLGWTPQGPGLLNDLDDPQYYA